MLKFSKSGCECAGEVFGEVLGGEVLSVSISRSNPSVKTWVVKFRGEVFWWQNIGNYCMNATTKIHHKTSPPNFPRSISRSIFRVPQNFTTRRPLPPIVGRCLEVFGDVFKRFLGVI